MNKIYNNLFGGWLVLTAILAVVFFLAPMALARERGEVFIINWQAVASVPPFYQGKIMPAEAGAARVNFELAVNGAPVGLQNNEIQWFVNNKLAARGVGLRSADLAAGALNDQEIVVRIVVKNFRGRDLEEIVVIPVARPETVIERRTANLFKAWPFFFSVAVKNIIFSWEVNGQKSQGRVGDSSLLELDLIGDSTGGVMVRAVAQNQLNPLEMAKNSLIIGR